MPRVYILVARSCMVMMHATMDSLAHPNHHIYIDTSHTHTHGMHIAVVYTRACYLSRRRKRDSFIPVRWVHIDPWFYNTLIVICIHASNSSFGSCLSSSSSSWSTMNGGRRRHDQNRYAVGAKAGMDDALSRCLCNASIVFSD